MYLVTAILGSQGFNLLRIYPLTFAHVQSGACMPVYRYGNNSILLPYCRKNASAR
jgi:hypothetical protein